MSEGKKPASYFTEAEDGSFLGPHTAEEIVKQIMTGSLKVEATIYGADDQRALRAADVIPLLHLPSGEISQHSTSGWTPPTRPTGLSETAPSSSEATSGPGSSNVSYFALFSEKRTNRTPPPSPVVQAQTIKTASKKKALAVVSPSPLQSQPKKIGALDWVQSFFSRFKSTPSNVVKVSFYQTYSRSLAAAAAVAVVFVGTYGLLRSLANKEKREPASQGGSAQQAPQAATKNRIRNRLAPTPPQVLSGSTELGSGQNHVLRRSGGVSEANRAAPAETATPPAVSDVAPPAQASGIAPPPENTAAAAEAQQAGAPPILENINPETAQAPVDARTPAEAVAPALDQNSNPNANFDTNGNPIPYQGDQAQELAPPPVPEQDAEVPADAPPPQE